MSGPEGTLTWTNGGASTDDHLAFGGHETHIVQIAHGLLPDRGVFVDIGAHVGLYSLNLADRASQVWAIEANPRTFETLVQNVETNQNLFPKTVFELHNVAAWDLHAQLELVDANGKETGGSTRCEPVPLHHDADRKFLVVGAPLDFTLPITCVPDLVKIDVEGAEARVLRGMRDIISRFKPTLLIEMHDTTYDLPQVRTQVLTFLKSQKYEWNDDLTSGEQYYILAMHPDTAPAHDFETVKPVADERIPW